MKNKIIIGTRTSKLALYQAHKVADELKKNFPNQEIKFKEVKTKGDILLNQSLNRQLDKGFFVKEIQELLLSNEIDIAVHSMKDLPVEDVKSLTISAVLERANPQDVFLSNKNKELKYFNKNEIIGTTSLRRKAQLLKLNSKLNIKDIRGNVDTRIKKMIDGKYDGLVMAAAGIERLNLKNHITEYISLDFFLNAHRQGAIAVEINENNVKIHEMVSKINHKKTMICTRSERNFMKKMGGGCNYPIGSYSYIKDNVLTLEGIILSLDGKKSIRHKVQTKNHDDNLPQILADKFETDNIKQLIKEIDDEIR